MQSEWLRHSGAPGGSAWWVMALAGGICSAVPAEVSAQAPPSGTWTGPGGEWTTGSNGTPAGAPSDTARFTNNGAPTAVNISNTTSINTMQFDTAAPAYSFTVTNGAGGQQQLCVATDLCGECRLDADHRRQCGRGPRDGRQ